MRGKAAFTTHPPPRELPGGPCGATTPWWVVPKASYNLPAFSCHGDGVYPSFSPGLELLTAGWVCLRGSWWGDEQRPGCVPPCCIPVRASKLIPGASNPVLGASDAASGPSNTISGPSNPIPGAAAAVRIPSTSLCRHLISRCTLQPSSHQPTPPSLMLLTQTPSTPLPAVLPPPCFDGF